MIFPPQITTVVLDFNGVISSDLNAAARTLGDFWGLPLKPEEAYARWRPIYIEASLGRISGEEYWRKLRASFGLSPGYSPAEEDRWLSRIVPLEPDMARTLTALGERYTLGLLSNHVGAWTRKLLARWGLRDRFRSVLISSDRGMRKPDLALYREICRMLGVRPESAAYVADEEEDVVAAERAGMFPVFIPGEDRESKVGTRIERLSELL
jgi:HAD superfamily hydrolase (TIGR01509 family)